MKITKNKKHRHIYIRDEIIRKIWKVPFDDSLTMSSSLEGDFRIYCYSNHVTKWEIEYSRKEIESKLVLLKGEKVIDFDYYIGGYKARIETTQENLEHLNLKRSKLNIFKRIFFSYVEGLTFEEVKILQLQT